MRPHLLEGDLQVASGSAQTRPYLRGSADGSVQSKAWGVNSPWGSRTKTQRRGTGGGVARAVPDRRLRGESQRAGSAVVPGCRHGGPGHGGQVQECLQRLQPPAFQRRPTVLTGHGVGQVHKGRRPGAPGDEGNGLSQGDWSSGAGPRRRSCCRPPDQGAVGQPGGAVAR